jgi:hypothetical protein
MSNRYQLVVEKGKSIIQSCTGEFITEIMRSDVSLPFLFFKKRNNEYLIYSETESKQIVFNCNIGHIKEFESENGFVWNKIIQLDQSKFRVWDKLGNSKLFDFDTWNSKL